MYAYYSGKQGMLKPTIMLTSVTDNGPTLNQHYFNISDSVCGASQLHTDKLDTNLVHTDDACAKHATQGCGGNAVAY